MLHFRASESLEHLREQFREWLKKNPSPIITTEASLESFIDVGRTWQKKLSESNWIGLHWPKEYGGRGLSLVAEAIIQEELGAADAPQVLGLFGLTMVGPVLIAHGTEAQKTK